MAEFLTTPQGRRIAYDLTAGKGPTIVFLSGLKSDMEGTKAVWLKDWALARGYGYLRFDYSGHGISDGAFTDGCIGDWFEDARAALSLVQGKVLLVGSSMGGWQALLLARALPDRIAGLVTIAAAPDFTEDGFWAEFDDAQRKAVMEQGQVSLPSDYDEPYIITRRLIEDGRERLVLRAPLHLPFPSRFLQGTADSSVSVAVATRLLDHATGPDMRLTLVKDADHRFSDDRCLSLIAAAVDEVLAAG